MSDWLLWLRGHETLLLCVGAATFVTVLPKVLT